MTSKTQEQILALTNKVQLLDFIITGLNVTHPDHKPTVDTIFKDVSAHKIKLIEELVRVARVELTTLDVVDTLPVA